MLPDPPAAPPSNPSEQEEAKDAPLEVPVVPGTTAPPPTESTPPAQDLSSIVTINPPTPAPTPAPATTPAVFTPPAQVLASTPVDVPSRPMPNAPQTVASPRRPPLILDASIAVLFAVLLAMVSRRL